MDKPRFLILSLLCTAIVMALVVAGFFFSTLILPTKEGIWFFCLIVGAGIGLALSFEKYF